MAESDYPRRARPGCRARQCCFGNLDEAVLRDLGRLLVLQVVTGGRLPQGDPANTMFFFAPTCTRDCTVGSLPGTTGGVVRADGYGRATDCQVGYRYAMGDRDLEDPARGPDDNDDLPLSLSQLEIGATSIRSPGSHLNLSSGALLTGNDLQRLQQCATGQENADSTVGAA
jgi:hypothetical protein